MAASLSNLKRDIRKASSPERAKVSRSFFKTGKGQYGEGDIFVGLTVPQCRALSKSYSDLSKSDLVRLLKSPIHEERLIALILLTEKFENADEKEREGIFSLYLKMTKYVNNWDLVDSSAHLIVGAWLEKRDRRLLVKLAKSKSLWERRIAIVATFHFIRLDDHRDTLKIAKLLLDDDQDLIHKATGWMLREVGKRSAETLRLFLRQNGAKMPRTMLRYAIERFSPAERARFLSL